MAGTSIERFKFTLQVGLPLTLRFGCKLTLRVRGMLLAFGVMCLSFLPSQWKILLHTRGPLHAWGHVYAFLGLCCLFVTGARTAWGRGAAVVGVLLLGCGIEGAQAGWIASAVEVHDLFFNFAGVTLGLLFASMHATTGVFTTRSGKGRLGRAPGPLLPTGSDWLWGASPSRSL